MASTAHSTDWVVAVVFADLVVLLVLSMVLSVLARWCRQPAVIGEILAGIALGPSLLGLFSPGLPDLLFPLEVRPYLAVLAQLGLVLFMFGVGYELDAGHLRRQGRAATVVSLASIALPFGLGALAALLLHPAHDVVAGEPVSELGPGVVPGRGHVDHGVPGAGPDPHRTRDCSGTGSASCRWAAPPSTTSSPGACWRSWSRWSPPAARPGWPAR
jgi:hypothetical protein